MTIWNYLVGVGNFLINLDLKGSLLFSQFCFPKMALAHFSTPELYPKLGRRQIFEEL